MFMMIVSNRYHVNNKFFLLYMLYMFRFRSTTEHFIFSLVFFVRCVDPVEPMGRNLAFTLFDHSERAKHGQS